jgi:hypothetical protein
VVSKIDCLPPKTTYIHPVGCIPLFSSPIPGAGVHIGNLVTADHTTHPQCGDPAAGDCFEPNGTRFCDDAECCERVCAVAPFCCEVGWNDNCAGLAREICPDIQACCFREATGAPVCANLEVRDCLAREGQPQGPGSACQGDNNNNGVDDACEASLQRSDPACGSSWPRSAKNFAKLTFDRDLTAPLPGQVQIRALLAGGVLGPDLSANFTLSVINDDAGDPRVLRIDEQGTVLADRAWYAIVWAGWADVAPFKIDILHLIGDADGNLRTLGADASLINAQISPLLQPDKRTDIDGNGRVLGADFSLANAKISPLTVIKPSGHTCNP